VYITEGVRQTVGLGAAAAAPPPPPAARQRSEALRQAAAARRSVVGADEFCVELKGVYAGATPPRDERGGRSAKGGVGPSRLQEDSLERGRLAALQRRLQDADAPGVEASTRVRRESAQGDTHEIEVPHTRATRRVTRPALRQHQTAPRT